MRQRSSMVYLHGIVEIDYINDKIREIRSQKSFLDTGFRIGAQEGVLKCTYTRDAVKGVIVCVGL